ncbi:ubiquinol-cytochrome c reductase iron-sulfur subunit [Haladaptatus sp. R4]|uniref:QcrA and Rieske domain-containing protein n=1 Tax=Haladaptatus sp. R4 TaxID=1679489 RepID=UPI00168009B9|nr:Rieske (2Fe-2S) protein [Haladaptatus sp. R4]
MAHDESNRPTDNAGTDEQTSEEERQREREGTLVKRADGDGYEYHPPEMSRRTVAKWLAAVGGGVAIGSIGVSTIGAISDAGVGAGRGSSYKTVYVKGTHLVDKNGARLNANNALPSGSGKERVVLPELRSGKPLKTSAAPTLLLRFPEGKYTKPTHTDWTADGYVAYSMVCTHEGCLVSERSGENLHCPCHNSIYDPLKGAEVLSGPAPRPLPQLPIGISTKGHLLVATGPFDAPIGPQ